MHLPEVPVVNKNCYLGIKGSRIYSDIPLYFVTRLPQKCFLELHHPKRSLCFEKENFSWSLETCGERNSAKEKFCAKTWTSLGKIREVGPIELLEK